MSSSLKFWWVVFFVYSVLAAVAVQFLLLPYVFPQWHWGVGLLQNHDWVTYHLIADQFATMIRQDGWRHWDIRPFGWAEPGYLSPLYVLGISKPWVLIPFDAFIHATTALLIMQLFLPFVSHKVRLAALAVLPFVFFPTALIWVTQIHKDGLAILGTTLYLYGWVVILRSRLKYVPLMTLIFGLAAVLVGSLLSWYIRLYLGQVLTALSILFSLLLSFSLLKRSQRTRQLMGTVALCWILTLGLRNTLRVGSYHVIAPDDPVITAKREALRLAEIAKRAEKERVLAAQEAARLSQIASGQATTIQPQPAQSTSALNPELAAIEARKTAVAEGVARLKAFKEKLELMEPPPEPEAPRLASAHPWKRTPLLPQFIENQLYAMSCIRRGYHATVGGRTNIDINDDFSSLSDVLRYIPRALQIAFLAPFPTSWSGKGSSEFSSLLRRIVGMEMVIVYVSLPFMLFFIWSRRRNRELWLLTSFSLVFMIIYTLGVPNLGTLHRFRYGFIMLYVGMGMVGMAEAVAAFEKFRFTLRLFSSKKASV